MCQVENFPISILFASATRVEGGFIVTVMEGDIDHGPGDIVEIAEADDLYTAVHAIQDRGTPMGGVHIRTGHGEWSQPDCITAVEALEASVA